MKETLVPQGAFPRRARQVKTSCDAGKNRQGAQRSSGTVCVNSGWGATTPNPPNERGFFPVSLIHS